MFFCRESGLPVLGSSSDAHFLRAFSAMSLHTHTLPTHTHTLSMVASPVYAPQQQMGGMQVRCIRPFCLCCLHTQTCTDTQTHTVRAHGQHSASQRSSPLLLLFPPLCVSLCLCSSPLFCFSILIHSLRQATLPFKCRPPQWVPQPQWVGE